MPVTGDWDIGGYYPANSTFYLYLLNQDCSTASLYKDVAFGLSSDVPLTGDCDWDGETFIVRAVYDYAEEGCPIVITV